MHVDRPTNRTKPQRPLRVGTRANNISDQFKIDGHSLVKFKKFCRMVQTKQLFSRETSTSRLFSRFYNKSRLHSINVFEDLYKGPQSRVRHGLAIPALAADSNLPGSADRTRRRKRISKFYGKNYGVFFDKPEFVSFQRLPERLKNQLKVERVWMRVIGRARRQREAGGQQSRLGKRPANVFDSEGVQEAGPGSNRGREQPSESRALFANNTDSSRNFCQLKARVLLRSGREQQSTWGGNQLSKPFLSVDADSMSSKKRVRSEDENENEGLSDQTDEMAKVIRSIKVLNSKSISDTVFRDTVIKIIQRVQEKSKNRKSGI